MTIRSGADLEKLVLKAKREALAGIKRIKNQTITSNINFGIKFSIDPEFPNTIEELEDGVNYGLQSAVQGLEVALSSALQAQWPWIAGTRDIVDTGELLNSQSVKFNGNEIEISYSAPYAQFVHEGGYMQPYGNPNAETVYIPGRPWISAVLYGDGPVPKFDVGDAILDNLKF